MTVCRKKLLALALYLNPAWACAGWQQAVPSCEPRVLLQPMAGAHMLPGHHGPAFAFANVGLSVAYEHPLSIYFVAGVRANAHFLLILPGTMPDGSNYIDSFNDVQATVRGRVPLCGSCRDIALGYVSIGLGPSIAFPDITGEEGPFFPGKFWLGMAGDAGLGVEIFPLSWMGLLVGTGIKAWGFFKSVAQDYFVAWNSGIGLIFTL